MVKPPPRGRLRGACIGALVMLTALSLFTLVPVGGNVAAANPQPAGPATSGQRPGYRPAACNAAPDNAAADSTPMARCYALGLTDKNGNLVQQADTPPATALGPDEIRAAYGLPDGGAGKTVAIVDAYGYQSAEADLAVFRSHYGLPPCGSQNGCFTKVDQSGGTNYPPDDPDWSVETALDLDAVSSVCPKCNILLVQGDDPSPDNLGTAVDTAARLGAVAISNSYGIAGENRWQSRYESHYDHPGIAVTVSTGDYGNVQSWPATNPNVTAVGGTLLERDASSARGWTESAWDSGGSGCSYYEPRPDYQAGIDTGCPDTRATADISADADPASGLAVYNTLGQDGWAQWGGTSLSSPLVAAMYALAGTAVPGTYPVTYPYQKRDRLNDVTTGSDGWCGNLLCNAGPGWDGPTGLGTPNGVSALTLGPYGYVEGTVSNAQTHAGLAGVTVTATDGSGAGFHALTDSSGAYRLAAPVGTYTVTAAKFGYTTGTSTSVPVDAATPVSRTFSLAGIPSRGVSGTITDGSGHGWPIYAAITIDGDPRGPIYTDPFTGRYQVDLPAGVSYTMHVAPVDLPGYLAKTLTVRVDPQQPGRTTDVRSDASLQVDASSCITPGYGYHYNGAGADFEGWGTSAQGGWQVTDAAGSGQTWLFNDPGHKGNLTGASGDFAIVDGWYYPGQRDTSLVSPAADLSGQANPVIGFDTYYSAWGDQTGSVDLSLDGGSTWSTVWQATTSDVHGHVEIPIAQAAGKSDVRVRFRYQGAYDNWWELDNVFVGARSCDAGVGGLVAGYVRDDNTGAPLSGATVITATNPVEVATSRQTPDDVEVGDGFYSMFVPATGSVPLTVSDRHYADANATVSVPADRAVRQDWRLQAGRLVVTSGTISATVEHGRTAYRQVRLTNTGTQPLQVSVVEQDRGYTTPDGTHLAAPPGAPLVHIKATGSPTPIGVHTASQPSAQASVTPQASTSAAAGTTAWTDLPEFPQRIMDNVVADDDGTPYSVGGVADNGLTTQGYRYDAGAKLWWRIADMPEAREAATGAFVDGKLIVVGGWDAAGNVMSTTYSYDPATNTWTRKADLPAQVTAAAATSVNGQLYVVAGCTTGNCAPASTATYRYDPDTDTWTKLADYPLGVAFLACAPAGNGVVCAGGVDPASWYHDPTNAAYQYSADANTWRPVAGMPYYAWGMAYAGVGGKLQVIGGLSYGTLTNQAAEFDPRTGSWSALPNANNAFYRGGATCGLYQVGGDDNGTFDMTPLAQQLPGYDSCIRGSGVPWLSVDRTEISVPAGQSVTVTVAMDASAVAASGEYDARLAFATDTPYATQPVPVAMTVR